MPSRISENTKRRVLLVVLLTTLSLLGSILVVPAMQHTIPPEAATEELPPHCLLRITHAQGQSRHRVCPQLNASTEYGQPMAISSRCTAVPLNLTAGCHTRGPLAVHVEWIQQLTTSVPPLTSSLIIPAHMQQQCASSPLTTTIATTDWVYYQLMDQTQRICGARRPWTCFGANHSGAGSKTTRTKCTFAYLHLPPDSLAVAIGNHCQQVLSSNNNNRNDNPLYHWRIWFASFLNIVRERLQQQIVERPGPNDIVVHLRLGDVVDGSAYSVQELLSSRRAYYPPDNRTVYVLPYSYYDYHLSDQRIQEADRIVLVGAAHGGYSNKTVRPRTLKSCYYVHLLREYFLQKRSAASVQLRLGGLPDDDVLYMVQSRYFVLGGGGFSRTIGWLVKELGGTVLGGGEGNPFFFPPVNTNITTTNQTPSDSS